MEEANVEMEVNEAQTVTEHEVIANIDVISIVEEGEITADADNNIATTTAAEQAAANRIDDNQQGPASKSPNDAKAREAAETLAMLSKPAYTLDFNNLWFSRYDKAKMEAKMDKPIPWGMRQLAKLEANGTAMFTGGFERLDTIENPMPIWDVELIPIQIIELYPKKRVPRCLLAQPNWDRIKDERAALRTHRRIRPSDTVRRNLNTQWIVS